jgi:hypothetical protein
VRRVPAVKRKSRRPHLLRARIGVVTHQVWSFHGGPPWLTVACEMASLTTPPRHLRVPHRARLVRSDVDCMACIALWRAP